MIADYQPFILSSNLLRLFQIIIIYLEIFLPVLNTERRDHLGEIYWAMKTKQNKKCSSLPLNSPFSLNTQDTHIRDFPFPKSLYSYLQ